MYRKKTVVICYVFICENATMFLKVFVLLNIRLSYVCIFNCLHVVEKCLVEYNFDVFCTEVHYIYSKKKTEKLNERAGTDCHHQKSYPL